MSWCNFTRRQSFRNTPQYWHGRESAREVWTSPRWEKLVFFFLYQSFRRRRVTAIGNTAKRLVYAVLLGFVFYTRVLGEVISPTTLPTDTCSRCGGKCGSPVSSDFKYRLPEDSEAPQGIARLIFSVDKLPFVPLARCHGHATVDMLTSAQLSFQSLRYRVC